MMGLLAGSKLASQTLTLTSGSNLLMSEIFPGVEHVRRFNLRTDKAREVLDEAETLLGVLAVPQVIALQEHLLVGMLELLEQNLTTLGNISRNVRAVNAHEAIQSATGGRFSTDSLDLFHLVRLARNTHIHNGAKASPALVNAVASTDARALEVWETITKTSLPAYQVGDEVRLGLSELIGILAVTKRLAEEANRLLQRALPRSTWADIAVLDWLDNRTPGNASQQSRQLLGISRRHYGPLSLTKVELEAAKTRTGVTQNKEELTS
ncbi:hypothetical protein [Nesterenkonia sp. Act20]|uniref:hypothetical protein n=1 Tax=Nesterenkonia sp. Act20 TaxID=1483432 RepID=UPI001C450601|nr:hypothetical protein [Nesterenkonia sp. Act20]